MPASLINSLIRQHKLIAILRCVPQSKVLKLADALHKGGVKILEFTFDHNQPEFISDTCQKVAMIRQAFGESLVIGCGTVLSTGEAESAQAAGAQLIISPHTDVHLIRRSKELGAVAIPGALTPTEIASAHYAGADFVKLFPADHLGTSYIQAVLAPLCHIPLLAVGGVKPENAAEYLNAGMAGFGVGSQLVESAALKNNDYNSITKRALAFTRAIAAWEANA